MVEHLDPPSLLVLHSTTHVPAGWRTRLGAAIDWAWTFALGSTGDGGTRLLLRVRGRVRLSTGSEGWELGPGDQSSCCPPGTGWRAWRTPPSS